MQRAVIYARVSSDKQEERQTIRSQLAVLRELCGRAGVEVVREYLDDGVSGASLERPALDRLRDDAARGLFDVVYIHSPDRLARKYLYQAVVLEDLRKRGVEVRFHDKLVTDRPEDQLLLGVQGLIAEYERAQIIERVRRGKLYRARSGAVQTSTPPYGYRLVRATAAAPARLEIDEGEAGGIREIFRTYIEQGSVLAVRRALHSRHIRPRSGSEWWNVAQIAKLLRSETCAGVWHYNKSGAAQGRRPRSEWVPIDVPALVDRATFDLAQRLLDRGNGGVRRRFYLLSRLLTCAHCGSTCGGERGGPAGYKKRYYRCGRAKAYPLRPKTCNARLVRAERLESAVVGALRRAVLRPEVLAKHIERLARGGSSGGPGRRRQLERKVHSLRRQRQRLLDVYLDGTLNKDAFAAKDAEFEHALSRTTADLDQLQSAVRPPRDVLLRHVERFCEQARARLARLTPEGLQAFLRLVVDDVVYDSFSGNARILCHVPMAGSPGGDRSHSQARGGEFPETGSNEALRFELTTEVPPSRRAPTLARLAA